MYRLFYANRQQFDLQCIFIVSQFPHLLYLHFNYKVMSFDIYMNFKDLDVNSFKVFETFSAKIFTLILKRGRFFHLRELGKKKKIKMPSAEILTQSAKR